MKKNSVLIAGIMIAAAALVAASISCSSSSAPAPNPASPQQGKATVSPNAWQVPVDVFPPSPSTNQIFTFVLQNAYWTGSAAKAKHERFLRLFRNPPRGKLVAMPATREGEDKHKK